jgi:chromosome segregation ATPase
MNAGDALAATIVTATASVIAALLATWQGRRAERSADSSRKIELAVTDFVDQLQEEREVLLDQIAALERRVTQLRADLDEAKEDLRAARDQLQEASHTIELREAEIIRLRRKVGFQ